MLSKRLRWGGGVRIFWRGVREQGGSSEPPEPPLVTGLDQSVGGTCSAIVKNYNAVKQNLLAVTWLAQDDTSSRSGAWRNG